VNAATSLFVAAAAPELFIIPTESTWGKIPGVCTGGEGILPVMISNGEAGLCELDKKILNAVQKDFPLTSHPFKEMAKQVGLNEEQFILRVKYLKGKGFIRRLGGVFDSKKLGFISTLVALRVSPEKLEQVAERVSLLPGVTHNYQREHYFNLWFTLVIPTPSKLEETLQAVQKYEGVEKLLNLPAQKLFKIGVNFKI